MYAVSDAECTSSLCQINLTNNTINNNTATSVGGAFEILSSGNATLTVSNNSFSNNSAP